MSLTLRISAKAMKRRNYQLLLDKQAVISLYIRIYCYLRVASFALATNVVYILSAAVRLILTPFVFIFLIFSQHRQSTALNDLTLRGHNAFMNHIDQQRQDKCDLNRE